MPGVIAEVVRFPAVPILTRPINAVTCSLALRSRLRRWRPDIILAFFAYPQGCASVWIGRRLGIPVVVGLRGSDIRRIFGLLVERQVKWTVRNAAAVTGVSRDLVRRAIGLGANPARAATILNGVRREVFHPKNRATIRNKLNIPATQEVVLFVGRLVSLKGFGDLLHAVASLAPVRDSLRIVCVGYGPMELEWRQTAKDLGIAGRVSFLGAKTPSEISDWLSAADLLCLPSHSEGTPNVILEAQACGCPVVATDVGGIPDVVGSESGILVSPGAPEQLAAAISSVFDTTGKDRTATQRVPREWADVARETLALCTSVLRSSNGDHNADASESK